MTQFEIMDFLKKHPKTWFNARQIEKKTEFSLNGIVTRMKALRKFELVDYKEIQDNHQRPTYYYKSKCTT